MKNLFCIKSQSESPPSVSPWCRHGRQRPWRLTFACLIFLVSRFLAPSAPAASDSIPVVGGAETAPAVPAGPIFKPNGRLCYDVAFYNENRNRLDNGTMLRFGRVGGRMQIQPDLTAALDVNFNNGKVAVDEAWGEYRGRLVVVKGGFFKEPLGLEVLSSVLNLAFMERSLPFALSPFRKTGFTLARNKALYTVTVGLFNGDIVHGDGEQGFAVTGRATFAPHFSEAGRLHFGAGVSRRTANADTSGARSVSFDAAPESRVDGTRFLNTGGIAGADYALTAEFEAAVRWQRVRIYSEYWVTEVRRSAGLAEPHFEGGYLAADVVLWGNQRDYVESSGVFGKVRPTSRGALELAGRVSWLDLNDSKASIDGGKGREYTLAVNWYFNSHIRWMMDYGIVENDAAADGAGDLRADDDYTFVQCRLQMSY